jgi:hypothetical protein
MAEETKSELKLLKPDTETTERFSVATAHVLQQNIGDALNNLYLKSQKRKLEEQDFAETMANISYAMLAKLRELKEVETPVLMRAATKIREALHV